MSLVVCIHGREILAPPRRGVQGANETMRGERSARCHAHCASEAELASASPLPSGVWFPGLGDTPTPVSSSTPPLLLAGTSVPRDAAATWPPVALPPGTPVTWWEATHSVHHGSLQVFCSSAGGSATCVTLTGSNPDPGARRQRQDGLASALSVASLSVPGLREARHGGWYEPANFRRQPAGSVPQLHGKRQTVVLHLGPCLF